MSIAKQNGDIIQFIKQKDYVMVNNGLGGGSFGKTVILKDPFIDELFVAKKYEPEFEEIKVQFYRNFLDEIKIMYRLNHNNVVRIYNYYAYEDAYTGYILMEYIDGENIGSYFYNYYPGETDITPDDIFVQLIDAFCYLEKHGIVHRDIREGNILIDKTGIVKLIDFGIGKIISKPEEIKDSLVGDINRAASDTLPQEYYEGTYTNLTDMFYLAELLNRLIQSSDFYDNDDFSYMDILQKMMAKQPQNRYPSFVAVKDAIGKHDFTNMSISDKDKQIYQEFTNSVRKAIAAYSEEPRFNFDTTVFLSKLSYIIKKNLFETFIQDNRDIINCVILCNYKYWPFDRIQIPVQTVKNFLEWFQNSTQQSQALILNNFISKLSTISIQEPEPELPF